ncbi:787_t:CDS:2, partial [Racocetra fulgida]
MAKQLDEWNRQIEELKNSFKIYKFESFSNLQKIVDGGFGTVRKAKWVDCGLDVALKRLKVADPDEKMVKSFIKEVCLVILSFMVKLDYNSDIIIINELYINNSLKLIKNKISEVSAASANNELVLPDNSILDSGAFNSKGDEVMINDNANGNVTSEENSEVNKKMVNDKVDNKVDNEMVNNAINETTVNNNAINEEGSKIINQSHFSLISKWIDGDYSEGDHSEEDNSTISHQYQFKLLIRGSNDGFKASE